MNIEKFNSYITKTENCWIWDGLIRPDGYPRFSIKTVGSYQPKYYQASKLSIILAQGISDAEEIILEYKKLKRINRICDNIFCVNPSHYRIEKNIIKHICRYCLKKIEDNN